LQALTLLNDPSVVEAARSLAARAVREGGSEPGQRVRWAWRTVLTRAPEEREAAVLERFYRQSLAHYQNDRKAAEALLSVGQAPRPADIDPAELAAWTAVARALFNLNEAITRN
jgi:hypothetical protein